MHPLKISKFTVSLELQQVARPFATCYVTWAVNLTSSHVILITDLFRYFASRMISLTSISGSCLNEALEQWICLSVSSLSSLISSTLIAGSTII